MGLLKRAHLSGMSYYLTREGIISWPTKLAEEEATDAVADDLDEIREETDETGLSKEEAEVALKKLVEVAEAISEKVSSLGISPDYSLNKEASAVSLEDAATYAAVRCMEKAAAENGPDVPGQQSPEPDLSATAEGEIDAEDYPSSSVVVPMGTSELSTRRGSVGAEEPQNQPGIQASAPTGEPAKLAYLLQALAAQRPDVMNKIAAADGASLSGGPVQGKPPTPRVDLQDNLNIPGVVTSRGQTAFEIPSSANVGVTRKQNNLPGVSAATPNNPAEDAYKQAAQALRQTPEGRMFLDAAAKEAAVAREDAVSGAIRALANLR